MGAHTGDSSQWTNVTWKTAPWPGSSIHRARRPETGEESSRQLGMGRAVKAPAGGGQGGGRTEGGSGDDSGLRETSVSGTDLGWEARA